MWVWTGAKPAAGSTSGVCPSSPHVTKLNVNMRLFALNPVLQRFQWKAVIYISVCAQEPEPTTADHDSASEPRETEDGCQSGHPDCDAEKLQPLHSSNKLLLHQKVLRCRSDGGARAGEEAVWWRWWTGSVDADRKVLFKCQRERSVWFRSSLSVHRIT